MKYSLYKILLWSILIIFVIVNSFRLFIYGFVVSFIIITLDRAFLGTRKRSDTQFFNLFFAISSILAVFYTFSPYFRNLEFKISHPKWKQYQIEELSCQDSKIVYTLSNIIEKRYTTIIVHYKNAEGNIETYPTEVKHYGLIIPPPFQNKQAIEDELNYIHNRSLNKILNKKSIHIFEHPHHKKIKIFKGNDAFALRHSIVFQVALFLSYIVAIVLSIYFLYQRKVLYKKFFSSNYGEKISTRILLGILLFVYLLISITMGHYFNFL